MELEDALAGLEAAIRATIADEVKRQLAVVLHAESNPPATTEASGTASEETEAEKRARSHTPLAEQEWRTRSLEIDEVEAITAVKALLRNVVPAKHVKHKTNKDYVLLCYGGNSAKQIVKLYFGPKRKSVGIFDGTFDPHGIGNKKRDVRHDIENVDDMIDRFGDAIIKYVKEQNF